MTSATRPTPVLPPVPRVRAPFRYWTRDKVRFADVDAVGHANNNAIGAYFETSRVELLRELGVSQTSAEIQCVLARMTVDFLAELSMFESIEVGDAVARAGNTSFTLHSALFVTRDGQEICAATCEAVCVLVDGKTHRPVPLPPVVRDRLAGYALPALP